MGKKRKTRRQKERGVLHTQKEIEKKPESVRDNRKTHLGQGGQKQQPEKKMEIRGLRRDLVLSGAMLAVFVILIVGFSLSDQVQGQLQDISKSLLELVMR